MVDPRTSLVPQTSAAIEPTRGVLDLARGSTTGEVGARRHAASRERLLDRLSRPAPVARARAGRSSKVYVLVAAAAALVFLGTGAALTARARPASVAALNLQVTPEISLGDGAPRAALLELAPFRRHARECWQSGLAAQPTMRGHVTLALTVDGAGHVSSAVLADQQGLSDEVARCVVRTAADLSFEPGEAAAFRLGVAFRSE